MWFQKSHLLSAAEVGRVGRNEHHRRTLKPVDGVQKDLVKGRHVGKSFFFCSCFLLFQAFPDVMTVQSKDTVTKKGTKTFFFLSLAF